MSYLGSWKIDDLVTFAANTHTPSTGAATDADSVPSYRVYEDETGTAILSGSMAKLDDANTTGFYSEQITLSAANGFEKGKCYTIYVSATVGGVVGTLHHTLQIEAEVDANRLNWANVDNPTTTVGLSGTTVKTATDVETDTADIQSRLPAALTAGGNIKADALALSGDTVAADNAESFFDGTGYAGTGNVIPTVMSVTAVAAGGITASSIATGAIDADALATDAVAEIQSGLSTLDAVGVRTAVGLASANLDTQLDALPTNAELATALGTADDAVLAAIAALNNLSSAGAQAAAEAALVAYGAATGSQVATVGGYVDTEIGTLQTTATAIKAKTDLITTGTELTIISGVDGGLLTIRRGDTLSAQWDGLGNISARTKLWFSLKEYPGDTDAQALIQIEETGGLLYLNAGAPGGSQTGDISVNDATAGDLTVTLSAAAAAALVLAKGLVYDLQMLTASGVTTLASGDAQVVADVTRAVN